MSFLFIYLRHRLRVILFFFAACMVFIASFWLYKLPVAAAVYPSLLCLAMLIAAFAYDFIKAMKKYNRLIETSKLASSMINSLPTASGLDDIGYQAIITALQSEVSELVSQSDIKYKNMIDYYTVWAHQIKTPIASMKLSLGASDSALSHKLSCELLRIEQYVEMVMTYLRLDSDYTDYIFKEHELDGIIKQSVRKLAPEFILKKLKIEYEPTDFKVVTDEKWLSFVVEQLLTNALKYTNEGSIKIFMRNKTELCISDTGVGIDKSDLPRIFEKGYTGCNGRSNDSSSGLGLYLCRRIIQNLGFTISAQSELGKGTCMVIDLSQNRVNVE